MLHVVGCEGSLIDLSFFFCTEPDAESGEAPGASATDTKPAEWTPLEIAKFNRALVKFGINFSMLGKYVFMRVCVCECNLWTHGRKWS